MLYSWFAAACICLIFQGQMKAQSAFTLPDSSGGQHHTQATLLLSADTAKPGDTVWAGLDLKMDPDWHTYWKSPGDAGMATEIKWQLPPGVTAGEIQWPLPKKLPPAEVTTYGYEGETMLLVPLTLAGNLAAGPLDLKADVSWLECKEQCIPVKVSVAATLNIGTETKSSTDAAAIQSWAGKVPKPLHDWTVNAWWESTTNADQRLLNVALNGPAIRDKWVAPDSVDFYPDASDQYSIQGGTEKITAPNSDDALRKVVQKFGGNWPATVSGTLAFQFGNTREGMTVSLPVAASAPVAAVTATPAPAAAVTTGQTEKPLWLMLISAFLGGLILNIMPCVLPVISLKVLGFVREAHGSAQRIRVFGAAYAAGVLFSFLVLAVVMIGLRAAGHQVGWGMQFGSPIFIVCLTTLVTLVALNLFGIFEVTLGGRAMNAANELASKSGVPGAFFNGMLATALATSCTAPILGSALGFALVRPAAIILLIFLLIGVGLASPYLVLSWNPAWLKYLPKPGAWMEKFKIAMGFPMLGAMVWLLYIAQATYGKNVFWLGGFLVFVAVAAWVFGEFYQRGRQRRGLALALVVILLITGYVYALENELHWRTPPPATETSSTTTVESDPGGIQWHPWSPQAVADARAKGRPVLVDFTADWCVNCLANKKLSIDIPSVRSKLHDINAVTLIGDDTRYLDSITTELQRFGRAGVPLVLVYPKNPEAQPIVLPEVLTPGIVLDALQQAAE